MKTLNKLLFTLLIPGALFISSCAAFRGLDMTKLSLGMDKETAYKTMGFKPTAVVVVKQYPSGVLEVVEYKLEHVDNTKPEKDWLYFFNNKLVQYGHPGDWQAEAEQIIAQHQN